MVASVEQIIGKINPKLYSENWKDLLKEYGNSERIPAEKVKPKSLSEHNLVYESSSETLEPLYFFILDLMNDFGLSPEKLVDNFSSSPGSGHFSELGQRATVMQQQGMNILGYVNTVLKSVMNLVYDLKDFKTRISLYDDLNSKDSNKSNSALLSLKQIWMDKVDVLKGGGSIHSMTTGQLGFVTLRDSFFAVKNVKEAERLDLNDRVKRVLSARIEEFNIWLAESENEIRKRYEIERSYLRSQVNTLKLYSRWARPYLKAAQNLEMVETGKNPALVKTFNTVILELTLLGKSKIKVRDAAIEGRLHENFKKLKLKRDYYSCILVNFIFRGIPQRVSPQQSHYVFGGRAEVSFNSYALN